MSRIRILSIVCVLITTALVAAQPQPHGSMIGYASEPGDIVVPADTGPSVKLLFDGIFYGRSGVGGNDPLILDAPWPLGQPLLDADDLDFEGVFGGRFEMTLYDPGPNPLDFRISYLFTEEGDTQESRSSSPADINFFGIRAASPADTYTAQNTTRVRLAELSMRRRVRPNVGVSAGLAYGNLKEQLNLVTGFEPVVSGFLSSTENDLYGFQLGADAEFWSNGYTRLEGSVNGGLFYNDMKVAAESLSWNQYWSDEKAAFVGGANIALVIPAWPFDFRVGYQATMFSGVALAADQSDSLSLFDGTGSIDTDTGVYHGAFIGIQYLR